jgi:hypothetical protein
VHDAVAARVGLGRAGIATSDDHAPDGAGCVGFVFVVSGGSGHGHGSTQKSYQRSVSSHQRFV